MLREALHNMRTNRKGAGGATAAKLKKLLPKCPVCNAASDSHQFALMGTTVIGDQEKPRVIKFFGHVKRHEWNDLNQFKDWQSQRDHLVAYAITCPHGAGMVVVVRSPFELYEADEVFLQETLTSEDLATVSGLVPQSEWQELVRRIGVYDE
jgi:hypothetical protein